MKETQKPRLIAIILKHTDFLDTKISNFYKHHQREFEHILTFDVDDDTHPLIYHELYELYVQEYSLTIESLLQEEGLSLDEFYSEADDILTKSHRHSEERITIQAVLAASEYDMFVRYVQDEARKAYDHK